MEEPSKLVKLTVSVLDEAKQLLIDKDREYGNSMGNPMRVFSAASISDALKVRIDDKLSRIARAPAKVKFKEDTELDLLVYLATLIAVQRHEGARNDGNGQASNSNS